MEKNLYTNNLDEAEKYTENLYELESPKKVVDGEFWNKGLAKILKNDVKFIERRLK